MRDGPPALPGRGGQPGPPGWPTPTGPRPAPRRRRSWPLTLALIVVFPIGLWVMWRRSPDLDRTTKGVVIAIAVAVVLVGLIAATSASPRSTAAVAQATLSPAAPAATPTEEPSPTPISTPSPTLSPTPTSIPTAIPAPTLAQAPPAPTQNLCGAPSNPWNYNFCGGALIYDPPSDFCAYFKCSRGWSAASGYVGECGNGTFSLSSGDGGCAEMRPLYG
jgi:hypothetical protein